MDAAVNIALAEMYVQGVSTRRVIDVLQRLLGPEITLSSAQVSRAAARLDEGLKAWRERPLGEVPYLFLDARYEKVRLEGRINDCAVLIAVGIDDYLCKPFTVGDLIAILKATPPLAQRNRSEISA